MEENKYKDHALFESKFTGIRYPKEGDEFALGFMDGKVLLLAKNYADAESLVEDFCLSKGCARTNIQYFKKLNGMCMLSTSFWHKTYKVTERYFKGKRAFTKEVTYVQTENIDEVLEQWQYLYEELDCEKTVTAEPLKLTGFLTRDCDVMQKYYEEKNVEKNE